MKIRKILFIIVAMLLFQTIFAFGKIEDNISDAATLINVTQIETSEQQLNEAFEILNKNLIGHKTEKLTIRQIELIIKKICPEILEYTSIKDLYLWIESDKKTNNLRALSNAIHEENHIYSYTAKNSTITKIERDFDGLRIWITYKDIDKIVTTYNINGINHIITPSKSFSTDKIKDLIPDENKRFFFNNYIMDNKSLSNQTGIFGLVNEYNSYAKELEFYKCYSHYVGNYTYSRKINYLDKLLREIENYIIAYLTYAETNYPEYYEEYMSNLELRQVYSRTKDKNKENTGGFYVPKSSPVYEIMNDENFREMQERFYIEEINNREN